MVENREVRSDVFSMLMEDKRNALEVYNALNGSDYTDPELELKCTVYNINSGTDNGILNKCRVLNEYTQFIEKIRDFESVNDESPISSAINWCIKNHILEEFMRARGSEVKKVMTLDMTFEHRMEINRREALEEGKAEERINCIKKLLKSGMTPEKIEEICGYSMQEILEVKSEM